MLELNVIETTRFTYYINLHLFHVVVTRHYLISKLIISLYLKMHDLIYILVHNSTSPPATSSGISY